MHHDIYIYEIIYINNRNKEKSDYSAIRVVNIDDNIKSICYKQYHLYEIAIYLERNRKIEISYKESTLKRIGSH